MTAGGSEPDLSAFQLEVARLRPQLSAARSPSDPWAPMRFPDLFRSVSEVPRLRVFCLFLVLGHCCLLSLERWGQWTMTACEEVP